MPIIISMRLFIFFLFLPVMAFASEAIFERTDMPQFDDYIVPISINVEPAADVDWGSHEEAWSFRTRLRNGLKDALSYAGEYVIVTHGCGTNCQVNWIMELSTGRIIDQVHSSLGIRYRVDSALLIKDEDILLTEGKGCSYLADEAVYYVLEDGALKELKRIVPNCIEGAPSEYPMQD